MSSIKFRYILIIFILAAGGEAKAAYSEYTGFLSLSVEYNYTDWKPYGINGVKYNTIGLNALEVSIDPLASVKKLSRRLGLSGFLLPLPKARYLFTPGNKADQEELLRNTTKLDSNEALEHLWLEAPFFKGMIPFFFTYLDLSFFIMYEKAAFLSELTLFEDKIYKPFGSVERNLYAGDVLVQKTEFTKYSLIAEVSKYRFFGGGGLYYQEYRKPYNPTVSGVVVDDTIIDAEFSSYGLVLLCGAKTEKIKIGSSLGFRFELYVGYGDIKFSDNEGLEQHLKENESILLSMFSMELEYKKRFSQHFEFNIKLGLEDYNYGHSDDETEEPDEDDSGSNNRILDIDLNRDTLYFVNAGISIRF